MTALEVIMLICQDPPNKTCTDLVMECSQMHQVVEKLDEEEAAIRCIMEKIGREKVRERLIELEVYYESA